MKNMGTSLVFSLSADMQSLVSLEVKKRVGLRLYKRMYRQVAISNPNRMWTAILADCIEFPHMPPQSFNQ